MAAEDLVRPPAEARSRSGFTAWLLQPSVLGVSGLALLALGAGSALLVWDTPAPPELGQLEQHTGVVATVRPRKVRWLGRNGSQTRLDGWILQLDSGAEFFLGTPDTFDSAMDLTTARTNAALPAGARVTLLADGDQAWQLQTGSSRIIDYAARREQFERSLVLAALIAVASLVLGALMTWSALKRLGSSPEQPH